MQLQNKSNEPQYLLNNYLKLLYAPTFSRECSFIEDEGYEVDWAILEAEQKARHGNLFSFLKLSNAPIFSHIKEDEMKKLVASYCDSVDFWVFKGRTLLENFCIYISNSEIYTNNLFLREVAKVSGIISGLHVTDVKKSIISPWGNQVALNQDIHPNICEEEFQTSIPLVNVNGEIQDTIISEVSQNHKYAISIKVIGKEKTEIHSRMIKNGK